MNLKLKKSDFLMAKRLKQRLAARQHKDRVGCMSGIVGIFDFRHGRITRRLLSDHTVYMNESTTGSLYPSSEGSSLKDSEEIHQQIESPKHEKNDTTQTRVKELMEEEMQCDQAGDLEDLIDHQLPSQKTAQYHELEEFVNKLLIIRQENNDEEEKPKSLERSSSLEHKRSNPVSVSEEHVARKPRNFFKRRSKSHECISLNDNDITPPSITPNGFHHERCASHFSFTEIKKKLKNAMTRSPRHSACREKPIVDGNGGWSSPNRDHFYSERFSRISNGFKRQDAVSRLSKSERKMGENMDFGETSDRVSNIYFEAKRHLSEMLNNENEHAELTVEDHSRSLGKLLAFPGYSSLSSAVGPQNEPMVSESQPSVTDAEHNLEIIEEVHQAEDEICKPPPSMEEIEVPDVSVMKNFQDSSEEDELSCSPASPSGSSLSISRKSEEVESTSDDKTGKPSPISVLEPMFSDDDISPARTITRSAESSIQPLRIRFEDTVTLGKNQDTCSLNSVENEESVFEYIEAVLLASDLNWDEFEKRWLSSIPILDPSLYDELQIFSSRPADDQLLLFDTTNEILEEICDRSLGLFPELSCLRSNTHRLPKGVDLINEVWDRIESRLNCRYSISLDQLIEKDLEVSKTWMDLRSETREIVIETEEWIFEDMIDDTVLSLMHA